MQLRVSDKNAIAFFVLVSPQFTALRAKTFMAGARALVALPCLPSLVSI